MTGGAGFIGSHVAQACLERGHEVCVLDDLSTGRRENVPEGASFHECDIRDGAAVDAVFEAFRPEVVSHQAAQTSVAVSTREPLRDAEINIMGSLRVLEASVRCEVQHIVFASTGGAIYGEVPDGQRANLDTTPRPISPYACSKFAVEGYLQCYQHEHGLRSTVLRYANVYGPRQDPHGEAGVIAIFCERMLAGKPVQINARREVGDDGCVRDYVYVGDVMRANLAAIEDTLGEPMINVCTGDATSTRKLAETLRELTGHTGAVAEAPRRAGDVERSVLDPGDPCPLGEMLGLADGLGRTLEWYRQRG